MSESRKYETAFVAALGAVVFLMRGSAELVFPGLLYALAALLVLNLTAEIALRRWPDNQWLATAAVLANVVCATWILDLSGGYVSRLWVLYLLPVQAACLLLPRSTAMITTAMSVVLISGYTAADAGVLGTSVLFPLAVKAAFLFFTGASVSAAARRERRAARRASRLAMVTARSRIERERERTERFEIVSRLAAELAHGFNGHLTTVLGACELASDTLPEGHSARSDLAAIRDTAHSCASMVENLRAASRRALLRPHAVEAGSLIEQSRAVVQEAVGEKVLVDIETQGAARVYVDPAQFRAALKHLAVRAKAAMGGRGILTLRMRGDKLAGYARFEVEDSGRPLTREERAALFQPFSAAALHSFSSGLGLAAAHGIIRQSGGQLSLADGEGPTVIRILLPAVCLLESGA